MAEFARKFSPEELQLYYQIVLEGRRELPYAPDGLSAFEMTLLRLLAFNLKKNGE
jgi:DNA polymerase-3 subunit gamma/tau